MDREDGLRKEETTAALGYLVLRVCLGVNIAMHGFSRLMAGHEFAVGLVKQFQDTFLPVWSVQAFGAALPWVEAAVGVLVFAGLFTRSALVAGGVVIAVLTFGTALVQQWDVAGVQLVYALVFAALLWLHRYNRFSLDRFLVGREVSRGVAGLAVVSTALWAAAGPGAHAAVPGPPVLVELFTSEGCSSCPPADAMLAEISRNLPGVIVLSEHVDYWNRLGWTDPYSSTESTRRQTDYAQRFGAEGSYTPQMVVNGTRQFVGGDRGALRQALAAESGRPALALTVARASDEKPRNMRVDVKLERSAVAGRLMAVLVQNQGQQQVARGENGGRTLTHVDIAREFRDLGDVQAGRGFAGETVFTLSGGERADGFHVVVFLQKGPGGEVLAVASTGTP